MSFSTAQIDDVTIFGVINVSPQITTDSIGHNRRHPYLSGSRLRLLHEPAMKTRDGKEVYNVFIGGRAFYFLIPGDPALNRGWYIGEMLYRVTSGDVGSNAAERIENLSKMEAHRRFREKVNEELEKVREEVVLEKLKEAETFASERVASVKDAIKSPRRSPETLAQSGRKSPACERELMLMNTSFAEDDQD